ncbi:methylthioadenosine phosphorylase [Metallosphaera sedula]|uniref:S-methyl-5'-thioadenosine phosphorylase n=3 Tax=Metallosphaera TaxID=41980 RepID=A4YEL2_METS5|nr:MULTISPECIES: S-methyl-5'-thioadenosine phosphorylase [Metallosphaera]ABP94864.1 methylthioadenosine phosphorylase [Metallosphaera sedula DSM 5348]AIM26851.1 methylthioadenosine phosphorylase [Metallosphaera sedula]AKV73795.1 5'-methylthioadenosine phosphorylase [Metallosphaera sedula]AKV76035.1 5'-methylthioadenosine phosphorylase [Metallosphaera sedula]AKV78286.1 5'-methylthioadenosine phosphorylase [Metallosphaera sedula]
MSSENRAQIAVIGGSGLYDPGIFSNTREIKVYTPYGEPSDLITLGELEGKVVAFLPRHGRRHRIPPHKINYRANIWALKELGVKWVISVSAVGSLNLGYKPGEFVIPDQFIDMTKRREYTFYDGPVVAHVSMAEPFCNSLRKVIIESAKRLNITTHPKGTYICIEGPRFSTRAESLVWKDVFKADIIGMTLVPEVNLACEAEMCYSTIAMITDYDVFAEVPVTAEEVTKVMSENTAKAKALLREVIRSLPEKPDERECSCCHSLKTALV